MRACFDFHAKEETEDVEASNQWLVESSDRGKGQHHDKHVFDHDRSIQLDNVVADHENDCLVHYVERQDGFVGVSEKSVGGRQVFVCETHHSDQPEPGV